MINFNKKTQIYSKGKLYYPDDVLTLTKVKENNNITKSVKIILVNDINLNS
jgi:hypothetical protein